MRVPGAHIICRLFGRPPLLPAPSSTPAKKGVNPYRPLSVPTDISSSLREVTRVGYRSRISGSERLLPRQDIAPRQSPTPENVVHGSRY